MKRGYLPGSSFEFGADTPLEPAAWSQHSSSHATTYQISDVHFTEVIGREAQLDSVFAVRPSVYMFESLRHIGWMFSKLHIDRVVVDLMIPQQKYLIEPEVPNASSIIQTRLEASVARPPLAEIGGPVTPLSSLEVVPDGSTVYRFAIDNPCLYTARTVQIEGEDFPERGLATHGSVKPDNYYVQFDELLFTLKNTELPETTPPETVAHVTVHAFGTLQCNLHVPLIHQPTLSLEDDQKSEASVLSKKENRDGLVAQIRSLVEKLRYFDN